MHANTNLPITFIRAQPHSEFRIDRIDPAYHTVAHGDGQTTAAYEAGVDVGRDPRPAAQRRPSVLRATESDSRQARLRRVRPRTMPALLRRRWPTGTGSWALLPVAADRLFRRSRRRAGDRLAGGRLVCPARVS